MLSRTSASAGLAAIATTAGTLFMTSPASAQSTAAPTHVSAVAAHVSASAPYDDGWWWHGRHHFRHHRHHFRHHRFHHHFRHHRFGGFHDVGFRHFGDFGFHRSAGFHHFGGFGGTFNRNVSVVSSDVGISNSNTNIGISHGW